MRTQPEKHTEPESRASTSIAGAVRQSIVAWRTCCRSPSPLRTAGKRAGAHAASFDGLSPRECQQGLMWLDGLMYKPGVWPCVRPKRCFKVSDRCMGSNHRCMHGPQLMCMGSDRCSWAPVGAWDSGRCMGSNRCMVSYRCMVFNKRVDKFMSAWAFMHGQLSCWRKLFIAKIACSETQHGGLAEDDTQYSRQCAVPEQCESRSVCDVADVACDEQGDSDQVEPIVLANHQRQQLARSRRGSRI